MGINVGYRRHGVSGGSGLTAVAAVALAGSLAGGRSSCSYERPDERAQGVRFSLVPGRPVHALSVPCCETCSATCCRGAESAGTRCGTRRAFMFTDVPGCAVHVLFVPSSRTCWCEAWSQPSDDGVRVLEEEFGCAWRPCPCAVRTLFSDLLEREEAAGEGRRLLHLLDCSVSLLHRLISASVRFAVRAHPSIDSGRWGAGLEHGCESVRWVAPVCHKEEMIQRAWEKRWAQ